MPSVVNVAIHTSQFPGRVRQDLLASLRIREVNHKFHYDSVKQTQKWLTLHQACSPSRNDADCAATYDAAFAATCQKIHAGKVHVVGLGCGGGQKDARLLNLLRTQRVQTGYTPCDVSTAMVLVAHETAKTVVAEQDCFPLVCDLATADGLPAVLATPGQAGATRLLTFFGMIPNFEPADILPKLASLVRPGDWLLFSANLAPGNNYAAGVQRILPQYDNSLTREWLLTFLLDLGVERYDGEIRFNVEDGALGLKRVAAHFHFSQPRQILIDSECFEFRAGESIRLFFSYRYTADRVSKLLGEHALNVIDQWIPRSREEGVFLCSKR